MCAAFYACAPSAPPDGSSSGSSGTSGTSGSSGGDDAASATDASHAPEGDATPTDGSPTLDGSPSDAAPDAVPDASDASADGGTCAACTTGGFLNGTPVPPLGEPLFCKGGCTWVSDGLSGDYRDICHANCNPVCAPDPPFAGVCPAACTGGCPGGVCNIICDGSDPSTSCRNTFNTFLQVEGPIVKCPEGLPCKVIGSNNGAQWNIIACPRGPVSCEVDCGTSGTGCGRADVYCGEGPCNIHGPITINDGTTAAFPEREWAAEVCGPSCKCDLPYPVLSANGAGGRCQCKDYQRLVGGFPQTVSCPKVCAAHGGWSEPWGRGPNSW